MPLLAATRDTKWPHVVLTSLATAAVAKMSLDVSAVSFSKVPGLVSMATSLVITVLLVPEEVFINLIKNKLFCLF